MTRRVVTAAMVAIFFLPVAILAVEATKEIVLKVEGMTWPSYGSAVAGALKRVDGVKKVDVRWEKG